MLRLEPKLVEQVRSALGAGWTCMGYSEDGMRDALPLASVRVDGAAVVDSKTGAVNVEPRLTVTLATKRSDKAAGELDDAFAAVVAQVHNWRPGEVSGRQWNPFSLQQAVPPEYLPDGLVGIALSFTTHARYDGQT